MEDNSGAPDAIGEPVTDLDEFWLEIARDTVKESISSLEEAAKQLISAVTLVEGIYTLRRYPSAICERSRLCRARMPG